MANEIQPLYDYMVGSSGIREADSAPSGRGNSGPLTRGSHRVAGAHPYDSLAEALERNGQLKAAREKYQKALELGQKNNDGNVAAFKRNLDRVTGLLAAAAAEEE